MNRTLDVTIDRSTCPTQPGVPVFPSTFHDGTGPLELNIPPLLLLIGYLTTPSHASGTSLSEFWAWVRYLHAVSDGSDLRLTREFSDLDAHQKTILSDDFGMGVPIYWLSEHFQLEPLVDGRYFMDRLAAANGAHVADPPKHGPRKAPGFVARDTSGAWHVIECKGTQTGNAYRRKQLGSPGPPATGAVAQKRMISFPSGCTGQLLACGLVLAVDGGCRPSSLRVIDPPADEGSVVKEGDLPVAVDTLRRATASRVLRLAEIGAVCSAISSLPSHSRVPEVLGNVRGKNLEVDLETTIQRAREQLTSRNGYQSFEEDDEEYLGRAIQFDLVAPADVQGPGIRSLLLRYGVTVEFIGAIGQEIEGYKHQASTVGSRSHSAGPLWHQMLGRARFKSSNANAMMRIGSSFLGEIRLLN